MIEATIPIRALSINEAFQGRRFKTKDCKDFCEDFLRVAPRMQILRGIVEVEYKFHIVNHKLADYDNMIKITQDLLVEKNLGYIEDDRKIYKATIYKIPCEKGRERIDILIKNYDILKI
ncbi:MAG: RusA family crossover junction endodeoxyribonuclease [Bacteroidales bacterium]|nr:RusA family crossover junction endodeoxyribonuclease [Bacteroidales bacterium]